MFEQEPIDVVPGSNFLHEGIEQKVGDIVGERPPDQEFSTENRIGPQP